MSDKIEYSLHLALYSFACHWRDFRSHRGGENVLTGWGSLIGTSDDDIVLRFSLMMKRALDRQAEIVLNSALPADSKDDYTTTVKIIKGFCSYQHFHRAVETYSDHFNPCRIAHMQALRDIMSANIANHHASKNDVQALDEYLERIQKEMKNFSIEMFLKAHISDEINFLRVAIKKFDLIGPLGIQACTGGLLSVLINRGKEISPEISNKIYAAVIGTALLVGHVGSFDSGVKVIQDNIKGISRFLKNTDLPFLKLLEYKPVLPDDGTTIK